MPEIRRYQADDCDEATDILARAYLGNPLHRVIFGGSGPEQLRHHRLLFSISLQFLNTGTKVVLVDDGQLVGFAHWIAYPGCRPSAKTMESAAPKLVDEFGTEVVAKVISWRRAWGEQDPETPHSHFGPFGVHPAAQGRGFGRRLLEHYCEIIDGTNEIGYLETERPENLPIYRKAGFDVTAERDVLGLPSWFMTRAARKHAVRQALAAEPRNR